jgi:itaconate CoA-transferase
VAPVHPDVTSDSGPLSGVTVVGLEQAVSAPMCTRTLGDFGARVIKVENPRGGDFARQFDDVVHGMAAHFVWLNRGKESVTLDLRAPEGVALLHRLLERADVFVSNLTPGATQRLGVGPAEVAARYPRLISAEISGYGSGGPLSGKRAYDMLVGAETGVCAITGLPGAPAKPGPPFADGVTGLYAALAIQAALHERERSGRGAQIAVSMFDAMIEFMGYPLTWTAYTGIDQQPVGMGSPAAVPYGAYPTADGRTVVLGTTNDAEWQRFAREVLQRPDLADDERYRRTVDRIARRAELDGLIAAWCAEHELGVISAAADAADIGNSVFRTPAAVLEHPHLRERDRWREVDSPVGPVRGLLPPAVFAGREAPMGAVPGLGEHTAAVLAELGVDDLDALRARGVV